MNNLFSDGNHNRFDPDCYLKTTSGSVLAFTKMLEAIAAGIGIVMLVLFPMRSREQLKKIYY